MFHVKHSKRKEGTKMKKVRNLTEEAYILLDSIERENRSTGNELIIDQTPYELVSHLEMYWGKIPDKSWDQLIDWFQLWDKMYYSWEEVILPWES